MADERNSVKQIEREVIKFAPRKFTARYAEEIRRAVKPARLTLINPTWARSDDGALEIKTAHGGGGFVENYQFTIRDKGEKIIRAKNIFDKFDNCTIQIGLDSFDGGLLFLKNRDGNEGELIISTFSWFLLEAFGLDFRENIGNIDVHQSNSKVRVEFNDNF